MGCYLWDWHCDDFSHHLLKLSGWATKNLHFPSWKMRPLLALLVAAIVFVGGRSSFAHRGLIRQWWHFQAIRLSIHWC